MSLCSKGHRYTGTRCPICTNTGRQRRPELGTYRWQKLAKMVKARDGNACRCCSSTAKLSVHHIERGGPTTADNLITLCSRCHSWAERGNLKVTNEVLTLKDMQDMAQ